MDALITTKSGRQYLVKEFYSFDPSRDPIRFNKERGSGCQYVLYISKSSFEAVQFGNFTNLKGKHFKHLKEELEYGQ